MFALPRLYVVNVVGESFLGHVLVDRAWLDIGIGAFIVLAVAVSIAIVLLWLRCDTPGRLWGTIALVMSIGVYCALTFWRGVDLVELHDGVKTGSGARYTGLGLQLLVAAFVIFIDRAALRAGVHQVLVVLVVAQAVLIPLTAFRLTTLRSDGPGWENQLAVSRAECEQQGTTESLVVITPSGWYVQIPCRDLR